MGTAVERRILIVAGEASGDAHAARLVRCLDATGRWRLRGVAGPALVEAGVEPIASTRDLAVVGFSGVLSRLPAIWRTWRRVLADAARLRPAAAVLVDSPGFNLRLGPELVRRGIPVFYYIAPQVWAWHPERAAEMAKWVTRLAVVFPFEEALFRAAGVDATFVGHPLLDGLAPEVDEATLRAELGVGPEQRLLGLLPGSRPGEVRLHLATMIEAARRLARDRADLVAVLPLAPGLDEPVIERAAPGMLAAARTRSGPLAWLRVVRGRTRAVQRHATACAVASGTATLETALFGTPLCAVYRVGRINYAIARRMVTLRHIALPNIVAADEVVPELIQSAFTPARLAERMAPWLDDPAARAAAAGRLVGGSARMGAPGASRRAAELLGEMLG